MNYDKYREYRAKLPEIQDPRLRTQATALLEFVHRTEDALFIKDKIIDPNQGSHFQMSHCLYDYKEREAMERIAQDARKRLDNIFTSQREKRG